MSLDWACAISVRTVETPPDGSPAPLSPECLPIRVTKPSARPCCANSRPPATARSSSCTTASRTIEIVCLGSLRQIVLKANLAVAHGQMHEDDLERVMLDFIDRRYDLLLATTIIESGLDIPNANTIFIDEGDRYGLADLHQLRGRVGRYKHRAYCYLLIDPNKNLSPQRRQAPARHRGVSATWARASPSPCATWKSAAPETSSAPNKADTSPRSATNSIAICWNMPSEASKNNLRKPPSRSMSICPAKATSPAPTFPTCG